jgi:hypothetical protein
LSKKYRNEDTKRRITPVLINEEADDKRFSAAKENTEVTPIPRRQTDTRGALNSQMRGDLTDKEAGM